MLNTGYNRFVVQSESYPAFPSYYRNPQSQADRDLSDRTTSVKKYFHNASTACNSFDVVQAATHDWEYPYPKLGYENYAYVQGTAYHAGYETEHIFEGQTIARYFTNWLPNLTDGHKHEKSWTESYVLSIHANWPANPDGGKFIDTLLNSTTTACQEE
jgi:chitinase